MGPGFESLKVHHKVGVFNAEGTPVPIPNTEVKLCSGDNTRLETAREDNTMPTPLVSVFNVEGTPVPIPNTEVKLLSGDNTRLETAREDNTMLTHTYKPRTETSGLCVL